MREGKGEYRGRKAIGYGYARVHLTCTNDDQPFDISVALDDNEWNNQLKDGGFPDWIDAAIYGCRYALNIGSVTQGRWEICRIVGTLADTIPTYVAIAAARAVWNICGFTVTELVEDQLNQFARSTFLPNRNTRRESDAN